MPSKQAEARMIATLKLRAFLLSGMIPTLTEPRKSWPSIADCICALIAIYMTHSYSYNKLGSYYFKNTLS